MQEHSNKGLHRPVAYPLLTKIHTFSTNGHYRELPISTYLVESNTHSTYLYPFTQPYHCQQDVFWQNKYFLEVFRTSDFQALVFKNIFVQHFDQGQINDHSDIALMAI